MWERRFSPLFLLVIQSKSATDDSEQQLLQFALANCNKQKGN